MAFLSRDFRTVKRDMLKSIDNALQRVKGNWNDIWEMRESTTLNS